MERGGGEAPRRGGVRDGGRVAGVGGHRGRVLGDGRQQSPHALGETVPLQVVELPELETHRRDGVDEGGRPQDSAKVRPPPLTQREPVSRRRSGPALTIVWFQDLGAGGGGRERDPVGGPGGRVEQRPLAAVASVQMVEHQETSVQSQGHPVQRYAQRRRFQWSNEPGRD